MIPVRVIFCPTDFSEPSRAALQAATELAAHFGSEICLAHVVPVIPTLPPDPNYVFKVPEYERLLHADAEKNLRTLSEEMIKQNVPVRTIVGHGPAAEEIVRLAGQESADIIVISTHGSTGWRHFVFGSVAEKVVRLAPCPVLTIRAPQARTGQQAAA
jgi:nucleotide-binding universal stress UspA family protein